VVVSAPKLRTDLIMSRQETREGVFFIVKDPQTRQFFRLREAEHFIAQQLDGATPLERVRHTVEQHFSAALAPETLTRFSDHLQRLGLLETDGTPRSAPAGPGRVRGTLLYLRFPAFDPDRFLARLVPRTGFLFTPAFVVLSACTILVALGVTAAYWSEIARDWRSLWRVHTLLLVWPTVLGVTVLHECAHGLTCKHFGGAVHEMGFMLLYFQPAFYCNVSDAWLFPEKAKRLWVTFAGAYFEIVLWALATLAWRVVEPGTWISVVALVVMATSGIRELLNLNPLIKLDGYYLLSDYLDVPNLRQKSLRYVGARLKRFVGGTGAAGAAASRRERRIYLVYGLLAGVYSYWLLSYVALRFGAYVVTRYQGVGVLLVGGFLMVVLHNPRRKLWAKVGAPFQRVRARLGAVPRPARPAGVWERVMDPRPPLTTGFPRPAGLWRPWDRLRIPRPVTGLLGLTVLLAVLGVVPLERKVTGEWTVLPVYNAEVRAQVDGTIAALAVAEGDAVEAGALLARLDDREARAELQKVEAEIAQQQAQLTMLQTGTRPEEVALARQAVETAQTRQTHAHKRAAEATRMHTERRARAAAAVTKAQERRKYAQRALAMMTELRAQDSISRKEFEEAEEQVAVRAQELAEVQAEHRLVLAEELAEVHREVALAAQALAEAHGRLRLVLAGSRPEEIAATEAALARLEAQRRYLAAQLALVAVVSPIAGVLTTPKLHEKRGQYVRKGDLIAQVHALQTVTVEIPIAEKEVAEVQPGQPIVLKARAYPGQTFAGAVTAVAPIAMPDGLGGSGRTVVVTTHLDNASHLLKPAMTGHAKILCGKRPLLVLLAQWCARTLRVEFWSWG
jgi:putative peptide zinc metalloprotease protein